jgi:hypothetical protein
MTPAEIRAYIGAQSEAVGVDPALSMGLAELTGYSPKWTDGKRMGILSLPSSHISDVAAYQSNPTAQIDAGLLMLSKDLEQSGNEFAALSQYTGSPKAAFKAYLRAARNRGQAVTEDEIAQSLTALNLDLDPVDEARKAGLALARPQPPQAVEPAPQPAPEPTQAAAPQAPPTQETELMQHEAVPDMSESFITSTPRQRANRVKSVFGGTEKDGDIPDDFLAHIKGLI